MEPEIVVDYRDEIGEGPMWHPKEQRLYWGDILKGLIYRYDPRTGEHGLIYDHGGPASGFTFQEDGGLLLFLEEGGIALWREGELTYLVKKLPGEDGHRFNDVIADPVGRVFAGTMSRLSDHGPAPGTYGRLYRVDTDGSVTQVLDHIATSNGLGFTPDRKHMYYTDSVARKIYIFAYDQESGEIFDQRVFVETPDGRGLPDGMTVDSEGYVWSARAMDATVYRYTPDGKEERSIRFPANLVSSLMFGGADLTDIYVTTIGGEDRATNGSGAGALFRMNLGIKGMTEFYSRIKV